MTAMPTMSEPDLFEHERAALLMAQSVHDHADAPLHECRAALGELMGHFERLMRDTSRLIRRSDRAELEMNRLNRQLQTLAEQLEYRATHDPLTGVLNRGAVIEGGSQALAQDSVCVIVLDIDDFKRINDAFGHPVGDAVIRDLAQCVSDVVADAARVGRVGGEEFTVFLPGHTLAQAMQVAEQIRECIARHTFRAPVGRTVTASFGVSANAAGASFNSAYARADEALYRAKREGRNRVVCA
jgi:diguanylate cyclase (GGDEF)-like protein